MTDFIGIVGSDFEYDHASLSDGAGTCYEETHSASFGWGLPLVTSLHASFGWIPALGVFSACFVDDRGTGWRKTWGCVPRNETVLLGGEWCLEVKALEKRFGFILYPASFCASLRAWTQGLRAAGTAPASFSGSGYRSICFERSFLAQRFLD